MPLNTEILYVIRNNIITHKITPGNVFVILFKLVSCR